ncbi:hypothetical protein C6503_25790 [Candidatus Poribacteria bacterium]|nr:MAG: hypothetical protein C6503_25790 [Candidatus Poribacteria bacterium]
MLQKRHSFLTGAHATKGDVRAEVLLSQNCPKFSIIIPNLKNELAFRRFGNFVKPNIQEAQRIAPLRTRFPFMRNGYSEIVFI